MKAYEVGDTVKLEKPYRPEMSTFEYENANDFCESMRKVLSRLSEIVQTENDKGEGKRYLVSFFGTDRDLFCRFIGFAKTELQTTEPKSIALDMLTEIAMAGISLAWDEGYARAKRIYSAA